MERPKGKPRYRTDDDFCLLFHGCPFIVKNQQDNWDIILTRKKRCRQKSIVYRMSRVEFDGF